MVVAGSFFVSGGFSPIDGPTHFRVTAAKNNDESKKKWKFCAFD